MPMGTEEEPEQQPCQRHRQLRPVYMGYFEDEGWEMGGEGGVRVLRFKEGKMLVCM